MYRAELLATNYVPLDDDELPRIRQRDAEAHPSCAIDGIHPTEEQLAFSALMIELRVPRPLARKYSDRFSHKRIVGPAVARQNEMEARKPKPGAVARASENGTRGYGAYDAQQDRNCRPLLLIPNKANMVIFPAIELYRAELNAISYTPLSDPKLAVLRQRYADAHHSCAIEDIYPDAEQLAFTALMVELRVPRDLASLYSDRFLQERIVGRALTQQKAAEAVKRRV